MSPIKKPTIPPYPIVVKRDVRLTTVAAVLITRFDYFFVIIQSVYYGLSKHYANNKADFILEYNESFSSPPRSLKHEDVDWSQSRVIFIAPEFTKYQQHAIGFKDVGIQL